MAWEDLQAGELYRIAFNAYHDWQKKDAIRALGRRARRGSDDAIWALGYIAQVAHHDWMKRMALEELASC